MNAIRFTLAAVWATMIWGSRAIGASRRHLPDTIGGPYDQAAFGWSRMLLDAARITERVEHPERLTRRNVVYIANHISMIDIPVLVTAVPVVPKFVMKQELLRVPLFGAAAKAAGHIAIDRRNRGAAFAAYDEAAKTISGTAVLYLLPLTTDPLLPAELGEGRHFKLTGVRVEAP